MEPGGEVSYSNAAVQLANTDRRYGRRCLITSRVVASAWPRLSKRLTNSRE